MNKIILTLFLTIISTTVFSQIVGAPQKEDYDKVFTSVEREAMFPGGLAGWKKYLEASLKAQLAADYIKLKRKQLSAKQTVYVQFIVDKDGAISEVRAINKPGEPEAHPVLVKEAIRVIKQGPNWIPAEQNNKKVIYQAVQNITFMVAR